MRLLRSITFVALAMFSSAFVTTSTIAAVPADYPSYNQIHQELKSKVAVYAADHAIARCKLPVSQVSTSLGRSIHSARSFGPVMHLSHRLPSVEFFRRC